MDDVTDKILLKILSVEEKMATKTDIEHLDKKIDNMLISTDRFVKLHETLDQELAMLRSKYNRLEDRVIVLEQRLIVA